MRILTAFWGHRYILTAAVIIFLILLVPAAWYISERPEKEEEVLFPSSLWDYTVIIDPGHGGYDPGALRDEAIEKDIVLDVSLALRDYLRMAGARVVLTRDDDYDLLDITEASKKRRDINNRLKIAEEAGGDILVSIHVNAIASPVWRGAQTFYLSDNQSGDSRRLAFLIQEELIRTLQNTDRYAKMANYYILQQSPVPAVIAEIGFISNPEEKELLCDPEYRKKTAMGIARGICRYFKGERAVEPDFPVSGLYSAGR